MVLFLMWYKIVLNRGAGVLPFPWRDLGVPNSFLFVLAAAGGDEERGGEGIPDRILRYDNFRKDMP